MVVIICKKKKTRTKQQFFPVFSSKGIHVWYIYMYDLAVLAGSSVGKKCVFLHAWDFFTMCKIFLSFVWWVWTSLKILYAKVPAGLALCQYKELIAVEILYIYCEQ